MTTKEKIHRLIDKLPEDDLQTAERLLEGLAATADPVLRALLAAPDEDEPISAEEEAAVQEARDELARGEPTVPLEDAKRELGL